MQTSFLERHADDILGAYSCFDRIISKVEHRDGTACFNNLFDEDDEQVFLAVAQGQAQSFGFRNADLRKRLDKTSAQISRICQRLRYHGLIKKAVCSYKYHLTALGKVGPRSRSASGATIIPFDVGASLAKPFRRASSSDAPTGFSDEHMSLKFLDVN